MLAAWLYAAVSGWSAPVVRAAGGFTLYLIAKHFYRRPRILNFLAAISLGFLLFDPRQMLDASFQLSFLSVAAIGALVAPLIERNFLPLAKAAADLEDPKGDLRHPPALAQWRIEIRLLLETFALCLNISATPIYRTVGWVLRGVLWVSESMLLSAVIQVALALPMALYFHRVSLSGVLANVIIVPVLSAVVPLGFAAVFTGLRPIAYVAELLLHFAEAVAAWHANWEPGWRIPDPPFWLSVAFVAALIAASVAARHSRWIRWPLSGAVVALFGILVAHPFASQLTSGVFELTAIDVGQGDSLLAVFPDGRTMLIDGGGIPAFKGRPKPKIDIGEDVVSSYLWTRSLHHIDVIALTHAHEDHSGGLVSLIENFRPSEVWTGAMSDNPVWNVIRDKANQRQAKIVARHNGEAFSWGGVSIRILAPFEDQFASPIPHNNDSLVMRIEHGQRSFLLTGDLEKPIEFRLADENQLRHADVLKVGHHGSRTSTTQDLIDRVQPLFAIVSAGYENLYHHPHPDVVRRLTEAHATILRTDQSGLISIVTDGKNLSVRTHAWGSDQPGVAPPFGPPLP
jgi:competence protein ComEC